MEFIAKKVYTIVTMDKNYKKYIQLSIIVLLFAVLATVLVWLAVDIRNLRKTGIIRVTHPLRHRHQLLAKPILQPAQIEGWMTFRYVNFVFNLPPNYLSGKLTITGAGYLNNTLDNYANSRKLDRAAFLASVKQAVTEYPNGGAK